MQVATKHRVASLALLGAMTSTLAAVDAVDPAPAEAHAAPEAWIGSPFDGCFATAGSVSYPENHHTFPWGMPYSGDVGYDQNCASPGEDVKLYAAPQNRERITAKIEQVLVTCKKKYSSESTSSRLRRGGRTVVVGIYASGRRIGWVTYAHLVNIPVSKGQWVSRWGTRVGDAGSFTRNSCWDDNVSDTDKGHVHIELTNEHHYACVNRGYRSWSRMRPTNFVGFIGGNRTMSARRRCP